MVNKIFPKNYEKAFQNLLAHGAIEEKAYQKVHAVLNWSVLDEQLATGEISYRQYDAVFSAMHDNIFASDVAQRRLKKRLPSGFLLPDLASVPQSAGWPFFISPSAFSTITQRNPWQAATEYYDTKMGFYAPGYVREAQQQLFDDGHDFESAFAAAFARKTKLLWIPSPFTYWNEDYPDILYNTDGWLIEIDQNGKPHLGLYEGKRTSLFSETQKAFARGEVPPYYLDQLAGYFAGLPFVEFAYINCGWGVNTAKDMRYIRVERDELYISEVMGIVEDFLTDCKNGVRPTLGNVTHPSAIQMSAQKIYGNGDPSLPPVLIPSSERDLFSELSRIDKQTETLQDERQKILAPLASDLTTLDEKIKTLEKQKARLLAPLYEVIGSATQGLFRLGDVTYKVSLPQTESFSFGAVQKKWLHENHPAVWDEMMRRWQMPRKLSYKTEKSH